MDRHLLNCDLDYPWMALYIPSLVQTEGRDANQVTATTSFCRVLASSLQMHACLFDNGDMTAHEDWLLMHAGSVQLEAEVDLVPHAVADLTPRGCLSGLAHPANEPGSVDESSAAEASTAIPAVQLQAAAGHSPTSRERAPDALRTTETLLFKGDHHHLQQLDPTLWSRRSAGKLSLCPDLVLKGSVLISADLAGDDGESVASRASGEEMDVEARHVPLLKLPQSSSAARDDDMEMGDQAEVPNLSLHSWETQ